MITIYRIKIPCSVCGKEIIKESRMTCSGACRVKASRDKEKVVTDYDGEVEIIQNPLPKKKKSKNVTNMLPVTEKLHIPQEMKNRWCEHGAMVGLCKYGCK